MQKLGDPASIQQEHFADVYAKLHVFGLSSFDRIVYLDADVIVLQNIDSLFLQPALSAACEKFFSSCLRAGLAGRDGGNHGCQFWATVWPSHSTASWVIRGNLYPHSKACIYALKFDTF